MVGSVLIPPQSSSSSTSSGIAGSSTTGAVMRTSPICAPGNAVSTAWTKGSASMAARSAARAFFSCSIRVSPPPAPLAAISQVRPVHAFSRDDRRRAGGLFSGAERV